MTTDYEKQHQVPCYALESSKPIWNGELKNCGMLLGTNVLSNLAIGFCIISNDGSKVMLKKWQNLMNRPCEQSNEVRAQINASHHMSD